MKDALIQIGCSFYTALLVDTVGADDYVPGGESLKNSDLTDTDENY